MVTERSSARGFARAICPRSPWRPLSRIRHALDYFFRRALLPELFSCEASLFNEAAAERSSRIERSRAFFSNSPLLRATFRASLSRRPTAAPSSPPANLATLSMDLAVLFLFLNAICTPHPTYYRQPAGRKSPSRLSRCPSTASACDREPGRLTSPPDGLGLHARPVRREVLSHQVENSRLRAAYPRRSGARKYPPQGLRETACCGSAYTRGHSAEKLAQSEAQAQIDNQGLLL